MRAELGAQQSPVFDACSGCDARSLLTLPLNRYTFTMGSGWRGVHAFRSMETARVDHAPRRRSGGMAARGAAKHVEAETADAARGRR